MVAFRTWVISLACIFAIGVGAAQAQQPKPAAPVKPSVPLAELGPHPLNVLVVDVSELLQNSKAAKMVRAQIEAKRAEYAKEIQRQEAQLRQERDTLQRQSSTLSAAAFNLKGREFQQKVNELDMNVQSKREALEKSNAAALGKIQQSMLKIITQIAKERKANLVFQRGELVLFDQQYDITDQVMQKLDEQLPTLTVSFVEPAPPPKPAPAPARARRR